ncbi:DUF397 domain-containing protein [Streptomyces luteolus]|uniref:DUF397 domain-containing protein n=1 Tax=Streptomyces luteolus TaxID=3043615 RepID=A0ABT6T2G9_9ACTN|nr:DUF397 domain-containing protein [Streptomyces sp. B-S-A12]MDI3421846.1 DUF397 domain-containing protein [Streptomyces sp. B-S-A12]
MTVETHLPRASVLVGWRKSSYSGGDQGNCVEVIDTLPAEALNAWRKSSYSGGDEGDCVEVLDNVPTAIPVRDSKNPHGPALLIPKHSWASFIRALNEDSV